MNQANGQLPTVYYNAPEVQSNRLSTPAFNVLPQNFGGVGYNQLQPSALFSDYRKADAVQVRRPIEGSLPFYYNPTPGYVGGSPATHFGANIRYYDPLRGGASYPYGRDNYERVYRPTPLLAPSYERQGYIRYSGGYPNGAYSTTSYAATSYPTTLYATNSYPASASVSYPAGPSLYSSWNSRNGNGNGWNPPSSIATPSYTSQYLPYSSVSIRAPYSTVSAALPSRVAVGDNSLSYGESNVVNVNRSPGTPWSPSRVVKGQGYVASNFAASSFADNGSAYYRGGLANGIGASYRVVAVGPGGPYNRY
jgi:hypothetical protein